MLLTYVLTALSANIWPGILPRQAIILCVVATCICLLLSKRFCFARSLAGIFAALVLLNVHAHSYNSNRAQADQLTEISSLTIQAVKYLRWSNGVELLVRTNSIQGKLKLRWYQPDFQLNIGDEINAVVKTKPPHSLANLGGFNYQRYLLSENIVATGTIKSAQLLQRHQQPPFFSALNRIRSSIQASLNGVDNHGVLLAIILGDRQFLEEQQRQTFAATGTAHLMAISGLQDRKSVV